MKWQGEIKGLKKKSGDKVVVVEGTEEVVSRRTTLVLAVVSFMGSMMFWSQNITGNAVLDFGKSSANWVGGILFVMAIIGFLLYVQKRKS